MTEGIRRPVDQAKFWQLSALEVKRHVRRIHARLSLLGREDSNLQSSDPESGEDQIGILAPNEPITLAIRDRADGAAGSNPDESGEPSAVLALEDRLLVAIAARGHRTIGVFIWQALQHTPTRLLGMTDEDLMLTLEAEAFS